MSNGTTPQHTRYIGQG